MKATLNDLYERAELGSTGMNQRTGVYGPIVQSTEQGNKYIVDRNYDPLKTIPNTIKDTVVNQNEDGGPSVNVDNLVGILTPPNPKYQFTLSDAGKDAYKKLEDLTNEQIIKQFFEVYYSPTGLGDITNRLGVVNSEIANLHELFPRGLPSVLSKGSNAAWRVGTNFAFQIDEGFNKPFVYTSYGFPPFVSKSGINPELLRPTSGKADYSDASFDLTNLLYQANNGTLRKPAFKTINDNINLIQYLMNRSFGIESTYLNEWDLSMYIQEGLVSYTYKELLDGSTAKIPSLPTTLTYGLLTDSPIAANLISPGDYVDVNLDDITPWAGVNMAVSERRGIDTLSTGLGANEMSYEVRKYPLSAWWIPPVGGETYSTLNISNYISSLFSYEYSGAAYSVGGPAKAKEKGKAIYYTPKDLHGGDLAKSEVPLDYIITYSDYRGALLSGWNSTDEAGGPMATGTYNGIKKGGAFSYLPYYKLFYTTPDSGYGSVDEYMQDLLGDQETFHSCITVGDEIVQKITSGNDIFQDYLDNQQEAVAGDTSLDASFNPDKGGSGGGESDIKILKVRIKGSSLLKMFLKRNKKSKQASDGGKVDNPLATANAGIEKGARNSGKAAEGTPGTNQRTSQPEQLGDENLGDMLTYGPGVAFYNPFLYGGPHGRYYSPLTLEGLVQLDNPSVVNIPKADCNEIYEELLKTTDGKTVGSQNYKEVNNYLDKKIIVGTTERNALIKGRFYKSESTVNVAYKGSYSAPYITKTKPAGATTYNSTSGYYYSTGSSGEKRGTFRQIKNGDSKVIWEPTIWSNATGDYARYETVTKSISEVFASFPGTNLRLFPVQKNFRMDGGVSSHAGLISLMHSDYQFFENSGYDSSGNSVRPSGTKYLVTNIPQSEGYVNVWGSQVFTGDKKGSSFYNYKKHLFDSFKKDSKNSTTFPVSLPIVNENGETVCLICADAKIEKDRVPFIDTRWERRLRWSFVWYRRWHTHRIWRWKFRHETFPWFRFNYWWEWYSVDFINHYDMYSMYILPDRVKYILPGKITVPEVAAGPRKPKAANTVARWAIDPETERGYEHLDHLWPFTNLYINRFGVSGNYRRPGVSASQYSITKTLKPSEIVIGDIIKDYLANGYTIYDRQLEGYFYDKKVVTISSYEETLDSKYEGSWGWESVSTSGGWVNRTVTLTSKNKIAKYTLVKNEGLTSFMSDIARTPSLMQIKNQAGKTRFYAYNIKDIFNSYIETCTAQLAWLNQLKWYASKCLKDSSIYYDYMHVTDPKILKVMACARDDTEFECNEEVYYTHTFMEDINYYDSLLILEKLFSMSTGNTNTILNLVKDRIFVIESLRKNVAKMRDGVDSENPWTLIDKLSKVMTETRLILSGAKVADVSVRDHVLRSDGGLVISNGTGVTSIRPRGQVEPNIVSYDVLNNPASVIWAYLNMLYQARKFYISLRMNKVQGSYWVLRSLEKVLTFNKEKMNTSNKKNLDIPINPKFAGDDMNVKFVAPRESYSSLSMDLSTITTYTQALYIPVSYVEQIDPVIKTTDNKWGTYNGKDVVFVKESERWAYKPTDGYYYVMSDIIVKGITDYLQAYNDRVGNVERRKFTFEELATPKTVNENRLALADWLITEREFSNIDVEGDIAEANKKKLLGSNIATYANEFLRYQENGLPDGSTPEEESFYELLDLVVRNACVAYWNEFYLDLINRSLYKLYIIWDPEGIKVALNMSNATIPYIDTFQKKESEKKARDASLAGLTVEDLDWPVEVMNEHLGGVKLESISSAITFGVANGINLDPIINNREGLKSLQPQEIICGMNATSDYWRIEVPEGTHDIETDKLSKGPRLISQASYDEFKSLLSGNVTANNVTSLVGVMAYRASPVKDFGADVLTSSTLTALGENVSVQSMGTGKTADESERAFN